MAEYNPRLGLIVSGGAAIAELRQLAVANRIPFWQDSQGNVWIQVLIPLDQERKYDSAPFSLGKVKDYPELKSLVFPDLLNKIKCWFCKYKWKPRKARAKYRCPRCHKQVDITR